MKPIRWKEGKYNAHFAYIGNIQVGTLCWATTRKEGDKDWTFRTLLPTKERDQVRVSGKEEAEKIIAHHVSALISELTEE